MLMSFSGHVAVSRRFFDMASPRSGDGRTYSKSALWVTTPLPVAYACTPWYYNDG